jgi:hypothetical protein
MLGSSNMLTKVVIAATEGSTQAAEFVALLNPGSYTLARSNRLVTAKNIAGRSRVYDVVQELGAFSLVLWLDGTGACGDEPGDLQGRLKLLRSFMEVDTELHRPPHLSITWDQVLFQGYMTQASEEFTLFDADGQPLRVKVTCTFNTSLGGDSSRNASPDLHRVHTVRDGDRIDLLADTAYHDCRYWFEIARRNHLVNPRALGTGADLVLPRMDRRR